MGRMIRKTAQVIVNHSLTGEKSEFEFFTLYRHVNLEKYRGLDNLPFKIHLDFKAIR